ncbi:MAG: hypothetical protein H6581_15555 [Bacteroidia bacterium]|nr:hypothetical protein [Bacteroidia bacterium]
MIPSTPFWPAFGANLRIFLFGAIFISMGFGLFAQSPYACEGEANHPCLLQTPKYQPTEAVSNPVSHLNSRQLKRVRTNSDLFSDLLVNVSQNPGKQAYLVTITFESKMRAPLHVNIINKRNRVRHSEVYSAREGKNLLLLDVESLREGDYRILISKGNQYLRSGFVKI